MNRANLLSLTIKHRKYSIASVIAIVILFASLTVFYNQYTSNQLSTKLSLNISLNQSSVIQGNNLQAKVHVVSIGKVENITLTSNSSSSGIDCIFEPSTGESNFTSKLTVNVPDNTPTGNYTIAITAFDNEQEQKASFALLVLSAKITVSGSIIVYHLWIPPTEVQFINIETHEVYKAPINNNSYCISLPANQSYGIEGNWNGRIFNATGIPIGGITMQLYGGEHSYPIGWILNLHNVTSPSITQKLQVGTPSS